MNNHITAKRLNGAFCLATLLLTLTLIAGCANDPIFAAIEEEVKLTDPTMTGTITSMEAVNGDVYAANGYLFRRTGGSGDWNKVSLPSGASRCSEIASDGTNLYARFTDSDYSPESVRMYNTSTDQWTTVTGVCDVALIGSGKNRIYAFVATSSANTAYNAYVTPSPGATAFTATAIATSIAPPARAGATSGDYFATEEAIYNYTGAVISSITGVTAITAVDIGSTTNLYALKSGYAYRFHGLTAGGVLTSSSSNEYIESDLTTPTAGIGYLGGSKNLLLLASGASEGGFSEVLLGSSDGTMGSEITPGSASTSCVAETAESQYDNTVGLWALYRIFAFTTPIPSGNTYAVYASVIDEEYDGLWSYYTTTNEWNRE